MEKIPICEGIWYIPGSSDPLSAEIGMVQDGETAWLYDVGCDKRAIPKLPDGCRVVLSHFHPDHTGNLGKIRARELYVSAETKRHVHAGTVVESDTRVGELRIFPLPSSHCKGCLGLEVRESYAFVGDALYCRTRGDFYVFDVQLLQQEIAVLKQLKAPYLLVSHYKGLVRRTDAVIAELEEIYSLRKKDSTEILIAR